MKSNYHNVKRYAILMLIGVVLNLGLYQIAHIFHLPMWIDNVGTAYVAMVLEPAAGLLVAFATNFYQATFVYDSSSLIYYAVSASCALCVGIIMRKQGKLCWKRLGFALLAYLVVSSLLSTALTLWRTAGLPDSSWECYFYEFGLSWGWPVPLACLLGIGTLKLIDNLVMLLLLPILYFITPKKFINEENTQIVSWKHPFFHREHEEVEE